VVSERAAAGGWSGGGVPAASSPRMAMGAGMWDGAHGVRFRERGSSVQYRLYVKSAPS
jgi:hypothetical protein